MRTSVQGLSAATAIAACLILPSSAAANVASAYHDYTTHGSINGCSHSAAELQADIGSVPTDVKQYDPRFVDALNRALSQRAGGCGGGGSQGHSGSGTPLNPLASTKARDASPKPPGAVVSPVSASPRPNLSPASSSFPTPLIALAALVALVVLGGGGLALRRRYA